MLGAIIGDIVGSIYERNNTKDYNFQLFTPASCFTDDTVCNVALLKAFQLNGSKTTKKDILTCLYHTCKMYDYVGYAKMFRAWLNDDSLLFKPYGSWGNGGAMRILMISEYFAKKDYTPASIAKKIQLCTNVTHNTPQALKGALCVSDCIYLCVKGFDKKYIKNFVEKNYYTLNFTYEGLVKDYKFDVSTEGSIPQAIFCFLDSTDFEDCLRKSVSIGGDSDTIAAIACSMAELHYKYIPLRFQLEALKRLPYNFLQTIDIKY